MKKGHTFRPGLHARHICHGATSAYCGFPNSSLNSQGMGMLAKTSTYGNVTDSAWSTCWLSCSCRYLWAQLGRLN